MAITNRRPSTWDDANWRDDAACRNADPDLFFPTATTGDAIEDTEAALAMCRRCAVHDQCLEFAMVTNQRDGIWGATSEEDRRRMRGAWVADRRRRDTGDAPKRRLRSATPAGQAR